MGLHTVHNSAGEVFTERVDTLSDKLFKNDPQYRYGMLYDWNLNPIQNVDFKLQKYKSRSAEGQEVEYYVQFPSGFQPEHLFKDLYYKKDGRERFGFYIDVEDKNRGITELWMIVNKDTRNSFDRYNVLRCNWCFEWMDEKGNYRKSIGCLRDASDSTFSNSRTDSLGDSTITGEISAILPLTQETMTILVNQRFIISDNLYNPQTFSVVKINDTNPLGIMRAYMKADSHNAHTDYIGNVNEETSYEFTFDLPLDDLPPQYGGPYHAICNCVKQRKEVPQYSSDRIHCELACESQKIYINGSPVRINILSAAPEFEDLYSRFKESAWQICIGDEIIDPSAYPVWFKAVIDDEGISLQAINRTLSGETISVSLTISQGGRIYTTNTIELEVSR